MQVFQFRRRFNQDVDLNGRQPRLSRLQKLLQLRNLVYFVRKYVQKLLVSIEHGGINVHNDRVEFRAAYARHRIISVSPIYSILRRPRTVAEVFGRDAISTVHKRHAVRIWDNAHEVRHYYALRRRPTEQVFEGAFANVSGVFAILLNRRLKSPAINV